MNKTQKYNADQERELLRLQCELARLKLRATQMQAASQQDNLVQMLWGGQHLTRLFTSRSALSLAMRSMSWRNKVMLSAIWLAWQWQQGKQK